jgi:hypothetical protein
VKKECAAALIQKDISVRESTNKFQQKIQELTTENESLSNKLLEKDVGLESTI